MSFIICKGCARYGHFFHNFSRYHYNLKKLYLSICLPFTGCADLAVINVDIIGMESVLTKAESKNSQQPSNSSNDATIFTNTTIATSTNNENNNANVKTVIVITTTQL